MTSLWNRIRSSAVAKESINGSVSGVLSNETHTPPTPTTTSKIQTPWTISNNNLIKKEPIRDFWIRTSFFRVSSQKLNLLGRQIARLSLPTAILQMKFSKKKAAREVHALLLQAQSRITKLKLINNQDQDQDQNNNHQQEQQIADPSKFIIQQALVGKGPYLKRIDIKGRGRHGLIWRPHSFLRLQIAIPDEEAMLNKRFKVKIQKENKPVMIRLNY